MSTKKILSIYLWLFLFIPTVTFPYVIYNQTSIKVFVSGVKLSWRPSMKKLIPPGGHEACNPSNSDCYGDILFLAGLNHGVWGCQLRTHIDNKPGNYFVISENGTIKIGNPGWCIINQYHD